MSPSCLKILLVEDDELFRLGLKTRLQQEPGIEITAEAEDGETALELVNSYPLDIVVLDVGLPGIGGIEACRQIKQIYPQLPILVLTSRSEATLLAKLIEVGAQGYCLKGVAAQKLVLAIRSVAAGASWWDATATQEIRSTFAGREAGIVTGISNAVAANNPLTGRELEILLLIATGKTNQQIAQTLYITPGTVRVHVHAILHKLEVGDRNAAITVAVQKGLIAVGM
ncbi:two-component response regulator [Calothrix sp. NIES-4071]|nr:two-component response regulator [Calothrix sp. NIES-4071]BAZ59871.1 two-component response regulator [Calothrix sp. NIES-4105]